MSAEAGLLPAHYRKVWRFVRRRAASAEDAEDLVQEVFANAAASLDARETDSRALAWLYTVARRRLADEARRRGRLPAASLELVADPAVREARYGREVAQTLTAALSRMPDGQRRVVLGRLIQGRGFTDLGRELGITEEACRMRFMRGLQLLRDEFTKEGLEP